jgi:hypothetical protein
MRLFQWNLTLQREIGRNIAVEAGYVANRGVWEEEQAAPATGAPLSALNAVSQQTLAKYGLLTSPTRPSRRSSLPPFRVFPPYSNNSWQIWVGACPTPTSQLTRRSFNR